MLFCASLPRAVYWCPPLIFGWRNLTLLCCGYNGLMRSNKSQMGKNIALVVRACRVITLFSRLPSSYLMAGALFFLSKKKKKKKFSCDYFTFCYTFTSFLLFFIFLSPCFFYPLFLSPTVFSVLRWEGIIMEPVFESFWFKQPDNGLLIEATRRQTIGFNAT